jgi:hypothetical protein
MKWSGCCQHLPPVDVHLPLQADLPERANATGRSFGFLYSSCGPRFDIHRPSSGHLRWSSGAQ